MKDNNPLVSVVVITYNSSKYVIETLDSIKLQTYNNIELIITDDCSQDDTVKICDDWINRNKDRFVRTLVVTSPINTGIPCNVNRGIKASNGVWIKGIAGDDILEENCINELYTYAMEYGCDIVASQVTSFDNDYNILDVIPDGNYEFPKDNDEQMLQLLKGKLKYSSPTWLFSKQLYDIIGGFNESYKLLDDIPFLFNAIKECRSLGYLKKTLVRYRKHDSVSKNEAWSEKQRNYMKVVYNVIREIFIPEMKIRGLYFLLLKRKINMWSYEKYFETDIKLIKLFYRFICHFSF